MLFRIREALRNWLIWVFMAKRNNLEALVEHSFSPEGYSQTHIANTTIITKYEKDADVRFFRECRPHRHLRQYVTEAVADYFDRISRCDQRAQLKQAVLTDLENPGNYARLTRISGIFNSHLMQILCGIYRDYEAAGVPCFCRFEAQEEFIAFIKYISGMVISQKTNAYLRPGMYENYSANKQLATYRLACMLGVDSLIMPVEVCTFYDGGTRRLGTMMKQAPGYPPSDLPPQQRTRLNIPAFLRDITNLEYLDALCYQLDHRLDNYYVVENTEGLISHVVTFDNDAARTFFVSDRLPKRTYAGCSGVLGADGKVARPYMDRTFAQAVLNCDRAKLNQAVGEFMSRCQLRCLWKRIRLLQKAITKTTVNNPDFLVDNWHTVDPQKETDSRYGCTYYSLYLTDTLMLDRKRLFEEMKKQQEK